MSYLIIISPLNNFRFSWLPVVEDEDEAPRVYGYLCDLIQANHPIILGANNSNLPRILTIISEVFARGVLPVQNVEATRMLGIVKQLESNPEMLQACVAVLSPEQKKGLEDAFRELSEAAAVPANN